MKRISSVLIFLLVASMTISAQERELSSDTEFHLDEEQRGLSLIPAVELSMDVQSRYMSDGVVINPDPGLFLDASAVWNFGLFVETWAAFDLNGFNNGTDKDGAYVNDRRNRCSEADYVIGYAYIFKDLIPISPLTMALSYEYFQYPRCNGPYSWSDDEYVNTTVKLDNVLPKDIDAWLSLSYTWLYGTRKYSNYCWADVAFGYNFTKKLSASITNKVFYACNSKLRETYSEVYGDDFVDMIFGNHGAFTTLESTIEAKYKLTKNLSIRAYVDCSWALDHTVRDVFKAVDYQNAFNIRYGAGCTYSF